MSLHDRLRDGELSDRHVRLRPVCSPDANWLQRASADPEVVCFTDIPDVFSLDDVSIWIAKRHRGWEGRLASVVRR